MRVSELLQNNKFQLVKDVFAKADVSFTYVHGFLTALATTPHALENIEYEDWLEVLFNEENMAGTLEEEFHEEMFDLLDAINDEIHDYEKFIPVVREGSIGYDDATIADVKPWCEGYVEAMKLFPEIWFEHDIDELHHALFPILSMTIDDQTLGEVIQKEGIGQSVEEFHQITLEILPSIIKGLYEDLYWIVEEQLAHEDDEEEDEDEDEREDDEEYDELDDDEEYEDEDELEEEYDELEEYDEDEDEEDEEDEFEELDEDEEEKIK